MISLITSSEAASSTWWHQQPCKETRLLIYLLSVYAYVHTHTHTHTEICSPNIQLWHYMTKYFLLTSLELLVVDFKLTLSLLVLFTLILSTSSVKRFCCRHSFASSTASSITSNCCSRFGKWKSVDCSQTLAKSVGKHYKFI